MSEIPKYSKVFNLGSPEVRFITSVPVTVQEKTDGAQFSAMTVGGKWHFRSRNQHINPEEPPKMFQPLVEHMLKQSTDACGGLVFRIEAFNGRRMNKMTYPRSPRGFGVLWQVDYFSDGYVNRSAFDDVTIGTWASAFHLEPVKSFGVFDEMDEDKLNELLESESGLGGGPMEGVVLKPNEPHYHPDSQMPLYGKWVSAKFREMNGSKKGPPSLKDPVTDLVKVFVTEARFEKVVQKLKEEQRYTGTTKDIGPCMKILSVDLDEEAKSSFDEMMVKFNDELWRQFKRKAGRNFPKWFQEKMLKAQFADNKAEEESDSE